MKASAHLADYIKGKEALRLSAYLDEVGVPTIGWGSTRGVVLPLTITVQEALRRFAADLDEAEAAVRRLVTVPLSQGAFDALVSWTFNLGAHRLEGSTLLRKLNAGDPTAPAEIPLWCHEGKLPSDGLLHRRCEELAMFLAG